MAKSSLATVETALRARNLDRTLTTALPSLDRTDPGAVLPTAIAPLDAALRGGVPRGQLSEITGPRSSGRTTLLLQLMASLTARGEIVALVDTFDRLDVASAVAAGVDLSRLLWVRGQAITRVQGSGLGPQPALGRAQPWAPSPEPWGLTDRTIDRSVKALGLVLQAGGFGLVALDLADVPMVALRQLPYTTWLRVQRTIEGSDTACVLTTPEPLARSAGGLTLTLDGTTAWNGTSDRSRRVAGLEMTARIVSPRRRMDGEVRVRGDFRG